MNKTDEFALGFLVSTDDSGKTLEVMLGHRVFSKQLNNNSYSESDYGLGYFKDEVGHHLMLSTGQRQKVWSI